MAKFCKKRKIVIKPNNYCDWFEKRKSNLVRHCCSNCKWIGNEENAPQKNETTKEVE